MSEEEFDIWTAASVGDLEFVKEKFTSNPKNVNGVNERFFQSYERFKNYNKIVLFRRLHFVCANHANKDFKIGKT